MQVWGDDGGELQFSADDQGADALTWIVDVPALFRQATQTPAPASPSPSIPDPRPAVPA